MTGLQANLKRAMVVLVLLALALVVAWPLWHGRLDSRQDDTSLDKRPTAGGPETLVTPKA